MFKTIIQKTLRVFEWICNVSSVLTWFNVTPAMAGAMITAFLVHHFDYLKNINPGISLIIFLGAFTIFLWLIIGIKKIFSKKEKQSKIIVISEREDTSPLYKKRIGPFLLLVAGIIIWGAFQLKSENKPLASVNSIPQITPTLQDIKPTSTPQNSKPRKRMPYQPRLNRKPKHIPKPNETDGKALIYNEGRIGNLTMNGVTIPDDVSLLKNKGNVGNSDMKNIDSIKTHKEKDFETRISDLADEGVTLKDELQCSLDQDNWKKIPPSEEKIKLKIDWENRVKDALSEYPVFERDFNKFNDTYDQFIRNSDNPGCPFDICNIQTDLCKEIRVLVWISHQKRN